MSRFVFRKGKVASGGSAPPGGSPAPVGGSSSYFKFWGAVVSMMGWKSVAYGSTPLSGTDSVASETAILQKYPLPSSQKPSYSVGVKWVDLEPSTATTNANSASQYSIAHVASLINAAQAAFPTSGCLIDLYFSLVSVNIATSVIPTRNWSTYGIAPPWVVLANGTPSNMQVPTTFGSNMAYVSGPAAPLYSGSSYYNLIFSSYDGSSQYQGVLPDLRNPVVVQALIQMLQWLSTATFTITTGPWQNGINGNPATWTIDSCPCVKLFAENTEMSVTFNSGPYQPQTPAGVPAFTWQAYMAGYVNFINAVQTALPHTPIAPCVSYGVTGQTGGASQNQDVAALFNPNIPFSVSSGAPPRFLPTVFYGDSDTYGLDFNASANLANQAKLGFIGIGPPGLNGTVYKEPLPPVTVASVTGVRGAVGQVQPGDYGGGLGALGTNYTASSVAALLSAMRPLSVSYANFSLGDNSTYDSATPAWTQYVQAGVLQYLSTYPLSSLLPFNLMQAPINLSGVAGTNGVALTWLAQSGVSYAVYRSTASGVTGSKLGTATSAAYTDTSAQPGNTYYYSVAMTNTNGTGPLSSQVVRT